MQKQGVIIPATEKRCYPFLLPPSNPTGSGTGASIKVRSRPRALSLDEQAPRADNSSNSSAGAMKPSGSAGQVNVVGRTSRPASTRQKEDEARANNAILVALSLFSLTRDTLKQPWLRASDIFDLGRNLAAARAADKAHARREFEHRKRYLGQLVALAADTATGRQVIEAVHRIAAASRTGVSYLKQNASDIKTERTGEKTTLRDRQLTQAAHALVDAIHDRFCKDRLSPLLLLVLHTCDHLLVYWYQESRQALDKPHEKPDLAFLDMARRNMMVNVLITYGLMKVHLKEATGEAQENIHAVMGAAFRKLNTSDRFDTLMKRSTKRMSVELKSRVEEGMLRRQRYDVLRQTLKAQGVDERYLIDAWRWLSQVQSTLGLPAFLQPYFEQSALQKGGLAAFVPSFKNIDVNRVSEWVLAASQAACEALKRQGLVVSRPEALQLTQVQSNLLCFSEAGLREAMKGFEQG